MTEGAATTITPATFTVTLSAASAQTVTVQYGTGDGTATPGILGDYNDTNGTLTFMPGEVTKNVTTNVVGDGTDEVDETFFLGLTNATNADFPATPSPYNAKATIVDDDDPSVSIADASGNEGNSGTANVATFNVTLSASPATTITVNYSTADGTGTTPADYVSKTGSVTFDAGATGAGLTKTITVNLAGDTLDEVDETFAVNLSLPNGTEATIADGAATGTITDDDAAPTFSIGDVTVTEGNAGTVPATFTVTLSAASAKQITIDYATANATAVSGVGGDYAAASGRLTFAPGTTTQPITVNVNGDTLDEDAETFDVDLSGSVNATTAGSDVRAVGTITDDDVAPGISVSDVTVTEGNSGNVAATFTVSLSAASGRTVTFDIATSNGTATEPSDYTANSAGRTISPGNTTTTFVVQVAGDTADETVETFAVDLANVVNASVVDGQGVGTITDDDGPTITIDDPMVTETDSGTVTATFTVQLSAASPQTVTVAFASANGTATAGSDYDAASGTLSFAPNETSKVIDVTVNGDIVDEVDETFDINLSSPTNATIADNKGVGTITDNDGPAIAVGDAAVTEANTTVNNTITFTVHLSSPSAQSVTVQYATADDTALADGIAGIPQRDYASSSGTLTFAAGEQDKTVVVTVHGDNTDEPTERFFLNLSAATDATIGDNQAIGTINDNDDPSASIGDVTVAEGAGTATFTVTLSGAPAEAVTVDYATADATATSPADYTAKSGTVSIPAGQTTGTLTITISEDALDELDETYQVNLSAPTNATIADGQGIGTITDNDPTPTTSVSDVASAESGTIVFSLTLSATSGRAVSVDFATADDTAVAPADYLANSGTVTFAPGETSKFVLVSIVDDTADEPTEQLFLNLTNPVGATTPDAQGVGTITDDDNPPTIAINDTSVTEGSSGTSTATFTVSLSAASGRTITVDYATAPSTATTPADFTAKTGTLSFAPGETSKPVTVTVVGDTVDEVDEQFFVNLSNPNANASISDAQGVGTITDDDGPSISVGDISPVEGDAGSADATFAIVLSAASPQSVAVDYATANGTATSGSDYTPASGTATFAPGTTVFNVTVPILGDTTDEANETFALNLTNPVRSTVADNQATATIVDDDQPALSINDVTVTEGDTGSSTVASFTVSLSSASPDPITVAYATAGSTATALSDYLATSGTLSFAAGQTSKTVDVTVLGDATDEVDETFVVNLSAPTNATIADAQGVGTIDDDDGRSITIGDVAVTEGNTGTTNATFTVTLSGTSVQDIKVDFATVNATATAPDDYTAQSGTLTIPAGQTTGTITVPVVGDALDELHETFTVNLTNAVDGTIGDNQAIGTINDNDATPTLSIGDVTVTEGDGSTVDATFTITLSAPSGRNVSVDYATANDTASAGSDYTAASGTAAIPAGQTTATVTVVVKSDTRNEANERFFVNLTNAVAATIADTQASGNITDDDATPALSIGDVTVTEGSAGTTAATFVVSLSSPSGQTVTVTYATADDSAVAPSDYTAVTPAVLTFAVGETTKNVTVNVQGDTLYELTEQFFVNLSGEGNATIADAQGIGTVNDDDTPPTVSVGDATVTEGNAGSVNATFTVTLSTASGRSVGVAYATADGTATAGADYTTSSGTVTIPTGQPSATFTVPVLGDTLDEPNETFAVNLSAPSGATIADGQGSGTITDDDQPSVSITDRTVNEGASGTTSATFTVALSSASPDPVSVAYNTANGTATTPIDYIAGTGTVNFAAGETAKDITVLVVGDGVDEVDETFFVNLSSPTNATIADNQGLGTINDDDGPTVSVSDASVTETDSGSTNATFTITLSATSVQPVQVDYATTPGTATSADFTEATATVTIAAGQLSATFTIAVLGDTLYENDESFAVDLSNPVDGTINDGHGVGTITDNDPLPTVAVNDVSGAEGTGAAGSIGFTITLSTVSGRDVTVDFATAPGSAQSPADFTSRTGTATIAAGQLTTTVDVATAPDSLDEPDESFTLGLTNPSGATVLDGSGTGTIADDDAAPTVSVADATTSEGNTGTKALTFAIATSAVSAQTVTVNFATAAGTATAGTDYRTTSGTATIPAGQQSVTITVDVVGDTADEVNETFTVNLSGATNATIAKATGVGTITDDDEPAPVTPAVAPQGYSLVGEDGSLYAFGTAKNLGDMRGKQLNAAIIGVAYTPGGNGYWLVAKDGGIFTFGDADFFGSMGDKKLNSPIIGMAATPTGKGYWLFAGDGGIFTFGDADFFGSMGDKKLNAPVINMEPLASGRGYWLVAADGGIFTFGLGDFFGSMGDKKLNQPVFDMTSTDSDQGYWLVARDGGIFSFGDAEAKFFGSAVNELPRPTKIIGMDSTPGSQGYWIADASGKVYRYGDAQDLGDRYFNANPAPMVAFATVPSLKP